MVADPVRGSERFHQLLEEIGNLHDKKEQDYGSEEVSYFNIRKGAEGWGIQPWVAAMVRASDKIGRLQRYVKDGMVANESAYDSLQDIAVYALIAHVLLEEQTKETVNG